MSDPGRSGPSATGRALFARALFDGERWSFGVRVELAAQGRIVRLGPGKRQRGDREVDVLLPALVNAHVHLDLPALPDAPHSFPTWLRAVIRMRGTAAVPGSVVPGNLARARQRGTAAVGDIDGTGVSRGALEAAGARGRCYAEVLGFDLGSEAAAARVRAACTMPSERIATGLSPHAPYSVSPALLASCVGTGVHLAVHVAETEDELRFLQDGRGPYRDLLEELGRFDRRWHPPGCSPLRWLHAAGATGPHCLLVHMQVFAPGDLDLLGTCGSPVVVCPGTIEHFGRAPPRVADMLACGVEVALGTDSLASNTDLDLFREMARLRRLCPDVAPQQVLTMATAAGGRALGLELGRLAVGLPCDAVAVAGSGATGETDLNEWLTAGEPAGVVLLRDGEPCEAAGFSL